MSIDLQLECASIREITVHRTVGGDARYASVGPSRSGEWGPYRGALYE